MGSTGISSAQSSYSVYELELCGAAFAMNQCRSYLSGRQFVLRTDHKALLNLENKDLDKIKNNRIIRLMEDILGYNFATQHLKGEQNQVADYLSRNPLEGELAPNYPHLLRESVPASVNLITAGKVVDLSQKKTGIHWCRR